MKRNLDKQELITMYKLRKKAGYIERSIEKSLPDTAERAAIIGKLRDLCMDIGASIELHGITMQEREEINSKG